MIRFCGEDCLFAGRQTLYREQREDNEKSVPGLLYLGLNEYDKAEAVLREAYGIRKEVSGESHPAYARSLDRLSLVLEAKGDSERAEPMFREAQAIREKAPADRTVY